MIHDKALAKLVERYQDESGKSLDGYLGFFARLPSVDEAIRKAYSTERGKVHPHQCLVGDAACERACKAIIGAKTAIAGCKSFEQLHDLIRERTENIWRFGPLAVYDYALRIGSRLRPRLHPTAVYLHNGTRDGYKALTGCRGGETTDGQDLPAPLRDLEPFHVENFLCIYADHLSGAATGGQSLCVLRPRRRRVC